MTTEKDPVEGPTDATSFCVCLKESVEQKTSRENGIDQDLEREHVKSPEGEEIGWMIKSVNDPVFPEACCQGKGFRRFRTIWALILRKTGKQRNFRHGDQ
jgi:hypothetical protein